MLNRIIETVQQYDKFVESYNTISEFMQKTENKTEELENEKILTLHFYDEYTDIEEYVIRLDSLNKYYELM